MKTTGILIVLAAAAVGCANNNATPTHRWASNETVSQVQYRNDHARCQSQAKLNPNDPAINTASPEYAAYSQCMNSSGYELTAYQGSR